MDKTKHTKFDVLYSSSTKWFKIYVGRDANNEDLYLDLSSTLNNNELKKSTFQFVDKDNVVVFNLKKLIKEA